MFCTWTLTGSRSSTTPSGMWSGISYCNRQQRGYVRHGHTWKLNQQIQIDQARRSREQQVIGWRKNLNRWKGQYSLEGKPTEKKITLKGQEVHYIDLSGTYKGSPFRKEPERPNYRLLGAIIVTQKLGSYYVKFYGPKNTVAAMSG